MSGSRRRWANNPYKLFILLREYDAAASAPRSDLCNCKIEFIFFPFSIFFVTKIFYLWDFRCGKIHCCCFFPLSLSLSLSQYLCINLRSYSRKIFSRCIFSTLFDSFSFCVHSMRCNTVQSCIEGESATHKYKLFCLDIPWIIYVAALLRRSMWTLHKTQCTKCNILDMLSWGGYREKDKPKL